MGFTTVNHSKLLVVVNHHQPPLINHHYRPLTIMNLRSPLLTTRFHPSFTGGAAECRVGDGQSSRAGELPGVDTLVGPPLDISWRHNDVVLMTAGTVTEK